MNFSSFFVVVCSILIVAQTQQVRQCSCEEGRKCLADLKPLGEGCMDSCWGEVNSITSNPQGLRKCFKDKNNIIENFIECFVDGMKGCANSTNGPQIPKQDFNHIITAAEDRIRKTVEKSLNDFGSENIAVVQPVVDAAEKFATCAKSCVSQKIGNDFCLATYNCQPLLPEEVKTKQLMHSCMVKEDLKQHAGDVCDCALAAGVSQLQTFCPVLDLIEALAVAIPIPNPPVQ